MQPRMQDVCTPVGVYDPSDDTFLLADACEAELTRCSSPRSLLCLDIGSGSGYVAQTLRIAGAGCVIATELTQRAASATSSTAQIRVPSSIDAHPVASAVACPAHVEVVQCDLVEPLRCRLQGCVDIIAVNPPYVPTDHAELERTADARSGSLSLAWAGGDQGRDVIDRMLVSLCKCLTQGGVLLLVVLDANDAEDVCSKLLHECSMSTAHVVESRRADEELLHLIRATQSRPHGSEQDGSVDAGERTLLERSEAREAASADQEGSATSA